jgi:DNA-binding NtrC family response regulator
LARQKTAGCVIRSCRNNWHAIKSRRICKEHKVPAPVVFVYDDPEFTERVAATLTQAGYDVAAFTDPMLALDALDAAKTIEMLITGVIFGPGKPHGLALALMARARRPNIRILFMAVPAAAEHITGWGQFVPLPATPAEVLGAVREILCCAGKRWSCPN